MLLPVILPENIFNIIHNTHRLDVALPAALLIGIGYSLKNKIDYSNTIYAVIASMIAAVSVTLNAMVNMNEYQYGNMLLFLAGALSGSYLVMYVSKKIENIPYVSSALCYIGRESMWILFFHEIISLLLNYILDVKMSDGVAIYRLVLYTVIAVGLPPLFIYFYNSVKERRKQPAVELEMR